MTTEMLTGLSFCQIAAFFFFCCPETTHSVVGSNAPDFDGKNFAKAFASASVGLVTLDRMLSARS